MKYFKYFKKHAIIHAILPSEFMTGMRFEPAYFQPWRLEEIPILFTEHLTSY